MAESKEKTSDLRRDFDRALELSSQGKENVAISSWQDFIRRYPRSHLLDNAYFHLAEIYQRQGKFEDAKKHFASSFSMASSDTAAQASLEYARCLMKQEMPREARIQLSAVIRRYPKSDSATQARLMIEDLK